MKWEEIVKTAKGDVGKSRDEVGCPGSYPWCAGYVSSVLKRCGIAGDVTSLSCTAMQHLMSESENWDEPDDYPKPGDIIFFDWDHAHGEELPLDHVGICVDFQRGLKQITYINGNGSSPHYVTEQVINLEAKSSEGYDLISYWMRYIGDRKEHPPDEAPTEDEPNEKPEDTFPEEKEVVLRVRQLRKGMSGGDVKTLQRLLFADGYSVGRCGDDGDFGDETEEAVLKYQRDHALDQDGIAGINTLTALWKCEPVSRKRK